MNKKNAIAIFDIGKTNKKILLFDEKINVIYQQEKRFETIYDEDGFECDDINYIGRWVASSILEIIDRNEYNIVGINFTTYGASLVFLDNQKQRLTPLYNYLKNIPDHICNDLFQKYSGKAEFWRKTASPYLGHLLNSGVQLLWIKHEKPEIFGKIKWVLHLPQYLSFLFTNKIFSEPTSIGCHTFMWDFDKGCYHDWLYDTGIFMPDIESNSLTTSVELSGKKIEIGIGIHDSSAALVPYLLGSTNKFVLISTGTWCISMNPFNQSPLTGNELNNDCLLYLNIDRQPIKSSRFFLGYVHDLNLKKLMDWFELGEDCIKGISLNGELLKDYIYQKKPKIFFSDGIPDDYIDNSVDLHQFDTISEAYHSMMFSLVLHNADSIKLISGPDNYINHFYVSGGFSRNEIYLRLLATFFPEKEIFTSEIDNASAMGAMLVIWNTLRSDHKPKLNLHLRKWHSLL